MTRDRSKDIEFLDMPWPIAVLAALSAVLVLKILISVRLVFGVMEMEPTAYMFDWAVVDRHAYLWSEGPRRGDVVTLHARGYFPQTYRVLGLPGDRVRFTHGAFELNGAPLERRCEKVLSPAPSEAFADTVVNDLTPDLLCEVDWPDVSKDVRTFDFSPGRLDDLDRMDHLREDTLIYSEHYLVVGDNGANLASAGLVLRHHREGREVIGQIRREDILGKVLFFIPTTKYLYCPQVVEAGARLEDDPTCRLLLAADRPA